MSEDPVQQDVGKFSKLRWSLIVIFLLFNIIIIFTYQNSNLLGLDSFLVTGIIFVLVFLYAAQRYGNKGAFVFFLVASAVSLFFENLSVQTGFPYGLYHYSPSLGILPVPLIIIFEYFAMGYLSWILANILTGQYSKKLEGKQIIIIPFIATFIMVMWDLTVDPISSTLQGLWVWNNPGAYFGISNYNYFGWFLAVFVIFQIMGLYFSKYDKITPEMSRNLSNKPFWSEGPVIYGIMALGTIMSIFYQYNDITLSMALITVFTMVFVAILALINIMNNSDLK